MKLVAISRVKNELDIIEAFVRHHCQHFDTLIVLDDGSTDGTYEVLKALQGAGLPLVLMREPSVGYEQSRYMTRLLRVAVDQFGADWIMPLDADEFIEPGPGATLAQRLESRAPALLKVCWHNFVWRFEDDEQEVNPVRRLRLRMPPSPQFKVLVPAGLVADGVAGLAQGSHELLRNGQALPAELFMGMPLCHFPIRTVAQYASKVAVGYLQYSAMPDWDRCMGFQYRDAYRLLLEGVDQLARAMPAHSRRYAFEEHWPATGEPRDAPLHYQGGQLTFTGQGGSMLSNVLQCSVAISDTLAERSRQYRTARQALAAARSAPTDTTVPTADRSGPRPGAAARPRPAAIDPAVPKHTFQSFWAGGALTPYESFCLRSFIDCGHAFDLYTFDTGLVVPAGVRVCDAAALCRPEELFVYQDGFGRGSPSAFANCFRYKLLAERGGWWVDTDVVCLAEDIPPFTEYFAWQDAELMNCAVLRFEPGHPLMVRCLEEALKLGRTVGWGETGPVLFTRLVGELGYGHRAVANGSCYPVHHSEAVDVLRSSKSASVGQRTKRSLFVHLWNEMLHYRGVQKTCLPPMGSMLRQWVDHSPVDGWNGEYDEHTLEHSLLMHSEVRRQAEDNHRLTAALAAGITERERLTADLAAGAAETARVSARLHTALEELTRRNDVLSRELGVSLADNERRRTEIEAMRHSTSWRLTAPVRVLGRCRVTLGSWNRRILVKSQ